MSTPKNNFVGELQEKCQEAHIALPKYNDESDGNNFKFSCTLKDWICHGTGTSKKFAKQNAAKAMLEKVEWGKLLTFESCGGSSKSSLSLLNEYCGKEKKKMPLFSELPSEGGLFCCQCTFEDYSAVGKGNSKKEAKEKAAFEIAEKFGVHKYWDNLKAQKERQQMIISPPHQLSTFCQKKCLSAPIYEEDEIKEGKLIKYKVYCSVGDLKLESSVAHSKKAAKHEVSTLMLHTLKDATPGASPAKDNEGDEKAVMKRKMKPESEDCMAPLKKSFIEDDE